MMKSQTTFSLFSMLCSLSRYQLITESMHDSCLLQSRPLLSFFYFSRLLIPWNMSPFVRTCFPKTFMYTYMFSENMYLRMDSNSRESTILKSKKNLRRRLLCNEKGISKFVQCPKQINYNDLTYVLDEMQN